MSVSATANVVVASACSVTAWADIMSVCGTATEPGLSLIGLATMRSIGG